MSYSEQSERDQVDLLVERITLLVLQHFDSAPVSIDVWKASPVLVFRAVAEAETPAAPASSVAAIVSRAIDKEFRFLPELQSRSWGPFVRRLLSRVSEVVEVSVDTSIVTTSRYLLSRSGYCDLIEPVIALELQWRALCLGRGDSGLSAA